MGESAEAAAVKALVDGQAQAAEAAKALMAGTAAKAQHVQDLASQLRREQAQNRQLSMAILAMQGQVDAREALASQVRLAHQASAASAKASYTAALRAKSDLVLSLSSAAIALRAKSAKAIARADKAERELMSQLPHFDGQGYAALQRPYLLLSHTAPAWALLHQLWRSS